MNKQIARIVLLITVAIVPPLARAGDLHVLVRSEVSGTEIVYHYELVNHGTSRMRNFTIGVTPNDPAEPDGPSLGTLTRLPTNTLWARAPARSLEYPDLPNRRACCLIPVPSPTSVGAPPGWRAEIGGLRVPNITYDSEDIARERYAITWYAPKPVYGGPLDITGADAGQRLSGFSVRVPQDSITGPGAVGSLANYTQGEFEAELWFGPSVIEDTSQRRRGTIEPAGSGGSDVTAPTVTITAPTSGSVILPSSTTVSATASDDVGVAGVQFYLNGASLGAEDTAAPYTTTWNTVGVSSGLYSLTARARDAAGNITTSSAVPVTVNACPTCNLPYGKVGTAYPVQTLKSGKWVSRVALKTGKYPPGMNAYRADYDGKSYRSLKFGGTPTAAGIYTFGLEVWLSPIGGGSITYWYPTYKIEITP